MNFREAARQLAAQGLATVPLRRNEDGLAKIPIPVSWQTTTATKSTLHDWTRAEGIGLVLGANSSNRAAIDVDDLELAGEVLAYFLARHLFPLMSYTARRRLHVHVVEPSPSASQALRLVFRGRKVGVELKAVGTQIAIPPTPRYEWVNPDWEPLYGSLAEIWNGVAHALAVTRDETAGQRGPAGYPRPFMDRVAAGERNNAVFVEGCRLADAGVPLLKALPFMFKRVASSYEPGHLTQKEIERTIRSAYRHALGTRP